MQPLERIRLNRLQNMLDWRLSQDNSKHPGRDAEAEALIWAIDRLEKCIGGDDNE